MSPGSVPGGHREYLVFVLRITDGDAQAFRQREIGIGCAGCEDVRNSGGVAQDRELVGARRMLQRTDRRPLRILVAEDAIIPVDVGNNTYSFGRYFECRRQAVLMSGYLGSIGFALPAAMGAWAATQEEDDRFQGRQVVSVSGDGGLGQHHPCTADTGQLLIV